MAEVNEPDIAQGLDTPSGGDTDTMPPDVQAIVAALEAETAAPVGHEAMSGDGLGAVAETGSAQAGAAAEAETGSAEAGAGAEAETRPPASEEIGDIPQACVEAGPIPRQATVPWWPFLVYVGAWVALSAITAFLVIQAPQGVAAFEAAMYERVVSAGLVLTAASPCLILAVWLATLVRTRGVSHAGLLTATLLRGALVTLLGVVMWCGTLVALDMLRFGRPV